jgi:hypothetical protein
MKNKELNEQPDETPMVLFQSDDGAVRLNVRLDGETVWLPQRLMALLFDCSTDNISLHLRNIFEEGELNEISVTEEFSVTAMDGKKYRTKHYNLDAIIAVGYRVNSHRATQFRIWATSVLKEYIVKGFALNDERMKTGRNMTYFDELQARIREIRLSERVFYQKIKDIYTTSVDYDPKNETTLLFFKVVQNKLLWAISLQTAAELVARRANAELPFMGMKSCDKKEEKRLTRQDSVTAKNYLSEDEIKSLGLLVEQYLAFAETQAHRNVAMTMQDWIDKLDAILTLNGRELLMHAGSISHQLAEEISALQYDKLQERLRRNEHDASLEELERDLNARKKKRGGKK